MGIPEQQKTQIETVFFVLNGHFTYNLLASAHQAGEMLHGRFSRSYIIKPGCSEVCKSHVYALVTFVFY